MKRTPIYMHHMYIHSCDHTSNKGVESLCILSEPRARCAYSEAVNITKQQSKP